MALKGPKIRFPPGSFARMADDGVIYEVVQLYRLQSAPSVWIYRLRQTFGFDSRRETHKIWQDPQRFPPESNVFDFNRAVNNQEMLRLAEHLVDDVMNS